MAITEKTRVKIALTWCLGWGGNRKPNTDIAELKQMQTALQQGDETNIPSQLQPSLNLVKSLQEIPEGAIASLQQLKENNLTG